LHEIHHLQRHVQAQGQQIVEQNKEGEPVARVGISAFRGVAPFAEDLGGFFVVALAQVPQVICWWARQEGNPENNKTKIEYSESKEKGKSS
jgi:hypothetical protein